MTLKKSYQIAKFIEANNPTRKEIVTHLIVNINKQVSAENFDYKNHYGHYSTNFGTWKNRGNVKVVDGRYKLTKQCIKNDYKLYSIPLKVRLKNALRRGDHFFSKYQKERYENMRLKNTIKRGDLTNTIQTRETNDLEKDYESLVLDNKKLLNDNIDLKNQINDLNNSNRRLYERIEDCGDEVVLKTQSRGISRTNDNEIQVQKNVKDLNINLTIKLS